jgi:hypothetical protein
VQVTGAAELLAAVVLSVNGLVGLAAGVLWYRVESPGWIWPALRVGQATAVLQAVGAGVLALAGFGPDGLYWLYALLPVAVFFVAEQLRIASAETVLEARGLEDARAVGRLPDDQQRSVVVAILRRELGVLAAAALVVAFLAARVFGTV